MRKIDRHTQDLVISRLSSLSRKEIFALARKIKAFAGSDSLVNGEWLRKLIENPPNDSGFSRIADVNNYIHLHEDEFSSENHRHQTFSGYTKDNARHAEKVS